LDRRIRTDNANSRDNAVCDRSYPPSIVCTGVIIDNVSGFTISQIFSSLAFDITTPEQYRQRLVNLHLGESTKAKPLPWNERAPLSTPLCQGASRIREFHGVKPSVRRPYSVKLHVCCYSTFFKEEHLAVRSKHEPCPDSYVSYLQHKKHESHSSMLIQIIALNSLSSARRYHPPQRKHL